MFGWICWRPAEPPRVAPTKARHRSGLPGSERASSRISCGVTATRCPPVRQLPDSSVSSTSGSMQSTWTMNRYPIPSRHGPSDDADLPRGGFAWFTLSVGLHSRSTHPPALDPALLRVCYAALRLWDVDVLINRTLVYGALTVILTILYVGLVIGLQALLRGSLLASQAI